jgi:hypothetical protein
LVFVLSQYTDEDGALISRQACKLGLEGIRVETAERALPVGPVAGSAQGQEPGQSRDGATSRGAMVIFACLGWTRCGRYTVIFLNWEQRNAPGEPWLESNRNRSAVILPMSCGSWAIRRWSGGAVLIGPGATALTRTPNAAPSSLSASAAARV